MAASASGSEKNATSPASASTPSSTSAPAPKAQSCVVCRRRKVRCDKQSPCSNCRRANIACVLPSKDRPPKWARRLERLTTNAAASNPPTLQDADPGVAKVMDRLRNLEGLVKELTGQLEQGQAAASAHGGGESSLYSLSTSAQHRGVEQQRHTSPIESTSSIEKPFGRLVLQGASQSRYVSSGFWTRVNDELEGLKTDTRGLEGDEFDSSEDEASSGKSPPTQELERTPSERHAFLFRHNLSPSAHDLREFHPLPSQIPFLLDVFSENVNFITQIVHMPTVTKMVRDLRGSDMMRLTPSNEALMFSIYYAAITSMEEDDVMTNFGSSKADLNLRYRLGLEHALAKADFLNAPDLVLVQAFVIFLSLVRRHDSPRFVWMMTGLVIRMAQYLGLQRDGSHFEHLTPFEIETRRKVWWTMCMLDVRASEDQGTDLTITSGSFDTKIPLNINAADISPESKEMPTEREGVTEMTFARINFGLWHIMWQLMNPSVRNGTASLEDQNRMVSEIYQKYEEGYFQHMTESGNIGFWVGSTVARLVMAKMTLIVFLPVLFSSPSEHFSDEIRTKLLVSAIEVAEYNHALNAEQACRQWRWVYQTYTHWHAIVYLLIDISRRPWSPIVERAWVALHSSWLIPVQNPTNKNLRVWFSLRKLMAKASRHRDAELSRLRADPQAAARLDTEDQNMPLPSSSGPFPAESGSSVDIFRERWRKLVNLSEPTDPSMPTIYASQQPTASAFAYNPGDLTSNITSEPTYLGTSGQHAAQNSEHIKFRNPEPALPTNAPSELAFSQPGLPYNPFTTIPADSSDGRTMGPGLGAWLWAETDSSDDMFPNLDLDPIDVNMDLGSEMNWYNWVESAKGMEMDASLSGNGRT
ncbi:uncharacterized protein BDZ99DRAFT_385394 [Mytilinidion resinicola]|uniref:Zn(2)-C6 fungal-type domain-containing protein n=1 Tax=Mytilinidion resinicola TaxID=574789 RepID=A0A6A6YR82_9PEZI|nr:uncharacterized protein BDZ99DRAFT_385394 [Mytilinidion resinicola]KAF2811281.1 hypothetical protein BDZ99DRAFT_385394 [Mytilinidion resinicola]